MKTTISILIAILCTVSAFTREITGTVVGEDNAPLDFVNVVLYQDSAYVAGNITDAEGRFAIVTDRPGQFTAKISSLGYEPYSTTVPESGSHGSNHTESLNTPPQRSCSQSDTPIHPSQR